MSIPEAQRWARAYADLGWRVFPVVAAGKKPMYTGWQADATTDPEQIARYWRRDPAPNIGVVCGEAFVAFDVEAQHLYALRAWVRGHRVAMPETPVARTGRGGIHVLTRVPFIGTTGRDLSLEGVHVGELKATGGFIVACPSVTTGLYAWLRSPVDMPVADAPEWLLGLVGGRPVPRPLATGPLSPSRAVALAHALYRLVVEAPDGERNNRLFWAACRAGEHGLEATATVEILTSAARHVGLSEREARATILSGLAR